MDEACHPLIPTYFSVISEPANPARKLQLKECSGLLLHLKYSLRGIPGRQRPYLLMYEVSMERALQKY
jgi:hypothetical protein